MKDPFCGITFELLRDLMAKQGFGDDIALKTVTNFYRRRIYDFSGMNNITKKVREFLEMRFEPGLFSPVRSERSSDLSAKFLFISASQKSFETVFIPDGKRRTVCVSTQSGCRMGCSFCLTGMYGFRGSLTTWEIINQVISIPFSEEITHVVFMGMGEPLDNTDELLKACTILTSSWGLALSPRHITVSTVGITPEVERFLNESKCNLTLSLHSPFPRERAEVIPAEKRYPAGKIINMMKEFPSAKKRRFSVAYIMIKDLNDSDTHLEELIRLLSGTAIRVNLLPYHAIDRFPMVTSPPERMEYFSQKLAASGISASVRRSRGADISAACGLLAANKFNK
ncbi:MAG: 23S rRNA (adenine(2503)-C(2))-methyltransferase RlmN [Bacteroidales bacterium]|jgi:23S rRNA (adenine2503-C2)-methyltransferase